jgi:hypothetical protein
LCTEGANLITGVLPEGQNKHKLHQLLIQLGHIQSFAKAEFLKEGEIMTLENAIEKFRTNWENYPTLRRTPKFHWLVVHLLPYVRTYKNWGLLSEQPVESIHRFVNEEIRKTSNTQNLQTVYARLTASACIRNSLFDENLAMEAMPNEEVGLPDEEFYNELSFGDKVSEV